jgi:hypothetical protein
MLDLTASTLDNMSVVLSINDYTPICNCRRELLLAATAVVSAAVLPGGLATAAVQGYTPMPALEGKDYGKPRMSYSNFVSTESGLQYNDIVRHPLSASPIPAAPLALLKLFIALKILLICVTSDLVAKNCFKLRCKISHCVIL